MTRVRAHAPLPADFAGPNSEDLARAQVVLRRFACTTNLLIPGRRFLIVAPSSGGCGDEGGAARRMCGALASALTAFGAHVDLVDDLPEDAHAEAVVILTDPEAPPRPGLITVLAPTTGPIRVLDPEGRELTGPHDPHDPGDDSPWAPRRIEWARERMPVTARAVRELAATGRLKGLKVGLALVLEPKTAVLALLLAEAGARVRVFSHADETRDDIAAVLRERGLEVFAEAGADEEREEALARAFLAPGLEFLLDDGSHLIRMAHDPERAPGALDSLSGAAEETTSGIRPLRAFPLTIPVIASNDARSKTLFDNAYATGQSCLLTVLDLLDPEGLGVPLPLQRAVVVGYGDVGMGCARFWRALGAAVTVVELDPVRELRARLDGFDTAPLLDALATADHAMSATGEPGTLPLAALEALPDGASVSVAGGVEGEVGLAEAIRAGWAFSEGGSRALGLLASPDGSRALRILDRGGCINTTAGEGNAIEIMDMSFGVQVSALAMLIERGSALGPGLHELDREADDRVARRALAREDD